MTTVRSLLRVYSPFYRALTVGVAATLLVVLVLQGLPIFNRAELSAYDYQFSMRGPLKQPSNLVVVGLDAPTIQDLQNGRYPIARHWIGQAITFLHHAHARAIGLDFLYASPSSYGPADDAAFARAIRQAGNVVLSSQLGGVDATNFLAGETQYTPPIDVLGPYAAGTGVANVPVDQDNEVRSALLQQQGPGGSNLSSKNYPALPVMLASVALHKPVGEVIHGLRNTMLINYVGPQNPGDASKQTLRVYQLEAVARGEDDPSIFKDKIVLIVPAALVTKDILNTPFGPMYGGFVQANALNTILQRNPIVPVSDLVNTLLILLLGFLTAFVAARFGIWHSTGAVFIVALGFAGADFILINVFRIWAHVVTPEVAIVIAFGAVMALRFATEERQRRRTAKIFGQYVKPEIVDILVNAPDEMAALAGTRRDISILFVDIRGFTAMSERMQPEEVVDALDVYLELLTASVLKFDGTINKYIGDEIVAIWNAPHHHPDHHMRAVKSALDMVARMEEMNGQLREKGLPAIKYGIGVNSGEAIVGQMGSSFRKQYDVIGDTVNTGARLCSAAGGGEVIIGQNTWEAIGHELVVEETEPLRLKGKSQALRTFLVLDVGGVREPVLEATRASV